MRSRSAFLALVLCATLCIPGTARAGYLALVPDATSQSGSTQGYIASFDTSANTLGTFFPGGQAMLGAAIAPDGRTAYVVGAQSRDLTPVDLTKTPPIPGTPLALFGDPTYIAIAPDGRKAYVGDGASGGDSKVIVIDLSGAAPAVAGTIDVGASPHGIAFTPDGRSAYVANFADGTVTPIDAATDTARTPIHVGVNPDQIAIAPDGATAYVTDNGANAVYPIAVATGAVGAPIVVGAGKEHPAGIAITPDGTKAYVANNGTESTGPGNGVTVTPIALATSTPGTPIVVGDLASGPFAVAVTPDSKTAYAVSWRGTYPIDTATDVPASPIGLAVNGRSIAIAPDQAPTADFSVISAPPGAATSFDASASTVDVGTIAKYDWDFGDGETATTTAPKTSHVYADPGDYTATLTETDSAGTSVDTFTYTGQTASRVGGARARTTRSVVVGSGPQPVVSLSAQRLDFGTLSNGTHSAVQTLTLANTGGAPLGITGSTLSGSTDFTLSDDGCSGQTVDAGAACTVGVGFTPSADGTHDATLAFTDDASGSPHTVTLTGGGFTPGIGTVPGFGTSTTTGTVTGVVSDGSVANLPPLPSSPVTLCTAGSSSGCLFTYTDGAGRFTFSAVPAASYVVLASPPSRSTLSQGSRVISVAAGATTDASVRLTRIPPLPSSMTFTSAGGTSSSGTPSVLHWDEAFQFSLPPVKPLGAHGTASSGQGTSLVVALRTPGDDAVVVGSVLSYAVSYDAAGKPKVATVKDTPLKGLVAGGFSFELGDLAVPAGDSVTVDPDTLAAATRIVVKSAGLHSIGHGALKLTVAAVHDEAPLAKAADVSSDACAIARKAVSDKQLAVSTLQVSLGLLKYQLEFGRTTASERENLELEIGGYENQLMGFQGQLAALSKLADDICALTPPAAAPAPPKCEPDDNIFDVGCELEGTVPVDPSGHVVTRKGVPVEKAKVVLERSAGAAGPFTAPPSGDAVMSVTNRRNPDTTDIDGHFGWDVFPGYYRVRATRAGCKGTALSKAYAVPPPVTTLRLVLDCPHLRRAATTTRVLSLHHKDESTIVTLAVSRHAIGMVNLSAGRTRTFAFLDKRGRARVVLPGSVKRVTVRYPGNARFAPSRTR